MMGFHPGDSSDRPEPTRELVVAHNAPTWLDRTEAWLWHQLAGLPGSIHSLVVADRRLNDGEFPLEDARIQILRERRRGADFLVEKSLRRAGIRAPRSLAQAIRSAGAGVLHSHFGPMAWSACRFARDAKLPHVVTFYGYDVNLVPRSHPRWTRRYAELFGDVQLVLCEGPHMARDLVAQGADSSAIRVHRLGVPLGGLPFRPRRVDASRPLRLLVAASFREKKGVPLAIEAASAFSTVHAATLTVVGGCDGSTKSRAEEARVLEAARAAKCEVDLVGSLPHSALVQAFYDHDVLLAPSVTARDGDTEGGAPVTVIEAAATGMPVVATRHCDLPDVLAETSELLAEERDVDGLVDRLSWLVERPWDDLVVRARDHIEREHDVQRQGLRLADAYREVSGWA